MASEIRNIEDDIRKLGRSSFVRRAAELVLSGQPPTDDTASLLLAVIADDSALSRREHVVAAWTLGNILLAYNQRLGAVSGLTNLFASLEEKAKGRTLRAFLRYVTRLCVFSVWFVTLPLICLATLLVRGNPSSAVVDFAGYLAGGVWVFLILRTVSLLTVDKNAIQTVAVDSIIRIGGWEAVTPLATVACGSNHALSRSAQLALLKILPNLSVEDRSLMGRSGRTALTTLLEAIYDPIFSPADERLCLQTLLLLRDIGGGESITVVEWAASSDTSPSRRQLASEILPIIRARSEREHAASGLLRVAEDTPTTPCFAQPPMQIRNALTKCFAP